MSVVTTALIPSSPTLDAVELTVVVPTFEERANVALLVERLNTALEGIAFEIIFVDDDSRDGTAPAVRAIGQTDPRVRCMRRLGRRGLAGACIDGMLAAQGRCVAVMDADLQHDENLLPLMLDILRGDRADIVIGSRYAVDGDVGDFSPRRAWLSRLAGTLAQQLLGLQVSDPMSGFFMMRRDTANAIAPKLSNQGFKLLMDILASAQGTLRVSELPYSFRMRQHGESKLDSRVLLEFAGLLAARMTRNVLPVRFIGFGIVGATGVMVHIATLEAAMSLAGLGFSAAQSVAAVVAMTSNFFLNNALTYRDRRLGGVAALRGLVRFYAVCAIGALSNLGIANWIYASSPVWWIAGLSGSLTGLVWNYAISTELVWGVRRS